MALNSAIAAYYYLKLVVYMFLKPAPEGIERIGVNSSRPLVVIVGIAAVITTFSIFIMGPMISYINYMVSVSGY